MTASPLVISGAFDLSPGSLHVAAEAGVDLFFWEETYAAMTRFLRARRQHTRAQVVTGSYHADGPSITRDVERALRRLRRETLDVFLLFWARSSARLDEDAFAALARLRQAGKVRAVGFSTHDRALASDALARAPWDVVMTRHSAAHPGIEAELLPQAQAAGAGILTFSALCYGRMVAGAGAPSAADCYRYSLSQPGVTACISAPRRHRELVENLEVLARPVLDEPALAALRAHGQGVRIENQRFGSLIRQPTRDAAAAAMAMLESTLPPVAGEPAGPAAPGGPGEPGEPSVSSVSSFRAARRRGSLAQPGPSSRLRRGRL
ncbi:MAG: aldo/keto reductase [Myxococcales bacterium]|nr:aldo/keto reductase [Myxococcales bacterium]